MKKYLIILAMSVIVSASFAQGSWQYGFTLGTSLNEAQFSGGMTNASALFNPQYYGSLELGFSVRKELNSHFSFQAGIYGSNIGFTYSIAQDYSLLQPWKQYQTNNVDIVTARVPASIVWNSKPNCNNARFYIGAGASVLITGKASYSDYIATASDALGNNGSSYLDQVATSNGGIALNGQILLGMEKTYNSGSIFSMGFFINQGFMPIATSTVTYNAENQVYNHTFTNYGSLVGWTWSYYFKPRVKVKQKALPALVPVNVS